MATAIMFLCLVLFAWLLKRLTETVYALPRAVANTAPVLAIVVLPLFFRYYSYTYDPAVLLLHSAALLFILQRGSSGSPSPSFWPPPTRKRRSC